MSEDLLALLPMSKSITIAGEEVNVAHFRFKQITDLALPVSVLANKIIALADSIKGPSPVVLPNGLEGEALEAAAAEEEARYAEEAEVVYRLKLSKIAIIALENGDHVAAIIAAAVGKPKSWVENLELDEVIELALAVVEVNNDFFVQRLAPAIGKLAERMRSGAR